MKIGYQGIIGCNSYRLINEKFKDYTAINYLFVEDLFISLENNIIDCFVLPIRNNTTGVIKNHEDLLNKYTNLKIIDEIPLKINHCLYGLRDSNLESIKKIISHKEALKQCSKFVSKYNIDEVWNTVGGIDIMINKNDLSIASIAPSKIINSKIKILNENISDNLNNETYFYIISKNSLIK